MIAIDTNILARWILRDDAAQCAIADGIMNGAIEIPTSVLLELVWLLESVIRLPRSKIAESMSVLLSIDMAHIPDREGIRWAIERYSLGGDWGDMIHLIGVQAATSFATFDLGISKAAGVASPVPIKTLTRG